MQKKHILPFEQTVVDMEEKLHEMQKLAEKQAKSSDKSSVKSLSQNISTLEKKMLKIKKSTYASLTRWQRVQVARHPERPFTLDYLSLITENFTKLCGDRLFGDDKAIVGGIAEIKEDNFSQPVVVVGHQKGRDTKSNLYRNFGMAEPEGYRKAVRLFKLAEKFQLPVITFIDTPGAAPGIGAEERGQAEAIAVSMYEMSKLRTPIICVIIGEGASGGAIGIGVGDKVLMLENAWYSVISPESCSSILWRNWEHKEEAAEALKLTANDLINVSIVDEIVPEPLGGAHENHKEMALTLKKAIVKNLRPLLKKKTDKLVQDRISKFA